MKRSTPSPKLLHLVAERFKALGAPARLEILNAPRDGERTVPGLDVTTGFGQFNVSKHLR